MSDTNEQAKRLSRRSAIGALAGTVVLVGCGGSNQSGDSKKGTGGGPCCDTGGQAGSASGGTSSGGTSSGGTSSGGTNSGGAAGEVATGGQAGAGGSAGASCTPTGPTPGCHVTDDNILGPFYKAGSPFKSDITDGVIGTPVVVEGTVYAADCVTPLANAIVDVWQANDAGAYDQVGYVLRGKLATDAQGHYEFRTILPGWYLNGATYRPRHIHYIVSHPSAVSLTTQLYFSCDPYIPTDAFVKSSLIMPLVEEQGPSGKQFRVKFDIVLA